MKLREYLALQVEEKKQTNELEKEKNLMFIKQVLVRDENERSEEKTKIQKKRQLESANHKYLETQIQEKKDGAFGMSSEEFLINKKLLKEISDVKKQLKNKKQQVFDEKALKPF